MEIIRAHRPLHVLVLAGDHIYKMDYGPMIGLHVEKEADITVGVVEVPLDRAKEFGVLTVDESNRVLRFDEKPQHPQPVPGRPDIALASMGIYVFNPKLLERLLRADANPTSVHDFGKNVPDAIDCCACSLSVRGRARRPRITGATSGWWMRITRRT
jgi:glucose-1-phosphate adenylyltransferase